MSRSLKDILTDVFLPTGYPQSVTPDYIDYQIWDSFQAFFSTITGMMSTQAVLKSLGVGDQNASSLNATLTWVMRDGLAMIARILFAYIYSSDMDMNVKVYRFLADIFNDLGLTLGLIAPLTASPIIFLCLSTLCLTLCGVCGQSTRFALTQHFARSMNACDVSSKDGSQEVIVNLVGMLIGSALLPMISSDIGDSGHLPILIFLFLTTMHLYCNYKAVCCVVFDTINAQRFDIIIKVYQDNRQLLTPKQVASLETVLWWNFTNVGSWKTKLGGATEEEFGKSMRLYHDKSGNKGKSSDSAALISQLQEIGWRFSGKNIKFD